MIDSFGKKFVNMYRKGMSTYCGKDCESCSYKEELQCSGCKTGPGRPIVGECKLARCCREKGHESCETCVNKRNCGMWLDKGSMAKQRKEKEEEDIRQKAIRIETAQALAKWVRILFWMVIPMELLALIGNDKFTELIPVLELPVSIGSCVVQLVYAGVLFRMSKEAEIYRKAALFLGVTTLIGLLAVLVPGTNGWAFLVSIPTLVLSIAAIYFEYTAHEEILVPFDPELSENWHKIWKWHLYGMLGIFASIILLAIIPLLGLFAILGCAILLIVAGILKYVYLYRMMKLFEEYSE